MVRRASLTPLRRVAALSLVALPSAALGQAADVLDDLRLPNSGFERGRFVTVRERPHPLYDPVPARIGAVELMPRLTIGAGYDSNIFAVRPATDDIVLRADARATASWERAGTAVEADAGVDRRQYLGQGAQSTTDYLLAGRLRYVVRRDTALFAGARAARETESPVDPSAPFNSRRPIQFDSRSAYAGAARDFGRLRIAARVAAEDRTYRNGTDFAGAPIDQSFRNRLLATAELGAEYQLSPDTSLFVQGLVNRRDYRNRPAAEPIRDSRGYRLEAGAGFMLTPLIRARLSAGYFHQDFDSPFFPTASGLAIRGRLDYAVTPLLTLGLTASRGLEESSNIETGAYVATRIGARADYELLRNLIVSATFSWERDRFEGLDRRYTIRRAGVGLRYRISRRFSLDVDYEGRDQDSFGTAPGRDFVRHQVTFGFTVQGI